jgi:glycosyltransferase involved in cell wall biosynthesis
LEIVVVSDGATDRTISIVQQFVSEKLRLIVIPQDGKWAAVTEAISRANKQNDMDFRCVRLRTGFRLTRTNRAQ